MSRSNVDAYVEQVRQLLKQGTSLSDIFDALASPGERELFDRLALVRCFDRKMFDEILTKVPSSIDNHPSFAKLILDSKLETAPADGSLAENDSHELDGAYRIAGPERQKILTAWNKTERSNAFQEINQRLFDYFSHSSWPGSEIEALYHQVACQSQLAIARFEELYAHAEDTFDLSRCHALLAIFADRRPLAREFADLSIRYSARLDARLLWAEDFYRTGRYLERGGLTSRVDSMRSSSSPCVLQIHAKGGSGKTMFLRWFSSRWCVPKCIPCAKIDFDDASALQLTNQPHLFSLAIARQWNRQLPGAPLRSLIESLSGASQRTEPILELARALPKDQVAFIILDTLEEVLIPHPQAMSRLLKFVQDIQQQNSLVRFILAGRYNLTERLDVKEQAWLESHSIECEIEKFSNEEARRFLVELSQLPTQTSEEVACIDAVITRAEGNPLKLWLYSVLLKESKLDAQSILNDSGVDVEYLIRRVVLRIGERERDPITKKIPDGLILLRWVMRYGVVPRRLTRDYLSSEFMLDRLEREIKSQSVQDNTQLGLSDSLQKANVFERRDMVGAIDVQALWQRLRDYASSSSWVRVGGSENVLVFSSDIVQPMRSLLLKQEPKLFAELHSEALAYFKEQLENIRDSSSEEYLETVLQIVYHDFQRRGELAGEDWRTEFDEPPFKSRPDWREKLALEVLDRTYISDEANPRPLLRNDGRSMLRHSDMALAYFQQARAYCELAQRHSGNASKADAYWQDASRSFQRYLQAMIGIPLVDGPIAKHVADVLESMIQAHLPGGNWRVAIEQLRLIRTNHAEKDIQLTALKAEIDILLKFVRHEAEAAIQDWLKLAKHSASDRERLEMRSQLALVQSDLERLDDAYESSLLGIQEARKVPLTEMEAILDMQARRILRKCGRAESAMEPLRLPSGGKSSPKNDPASWKIALAFLKVDANIALLSPKTAAKELTAARARLRDLDRKQASGVNDSLIPSEPETDELNARIAAAHLDHNQAVEHWYAARKSWLDSILRQANGREAARMEWTPLFRADQITIELARYIYRECGQLNAAMSELETLQQRSFSELSLAQDLHSRLLSAEMSYTTNPIAARAHLDQCYEKIDYVTPSSLRAQLALASLALGDPQKKNEYLADLIESLGKIYPASARLAMLDGLTHYPAQDGLSKEQLGKLNSLIFENYSESLEVREKACLQLIACEVLRVTGQWKLARQALAEARSVLLNEQESASVVRRLLSAEDRLGNFIEAWELGNTWLPQLASAYARSDRERMSSIIAWLEQAERALAVLQSGQSTELQRWLTAARAPLNEVERRLVSQDGIWATWPRARLNLVRAEIFRLEGEATDERKCRDAARRDFASLGLDSDLLPWWLRLIDDPGPELAYVSERSSDATLFPKANCVDIRLVRTFDEVTSSLLHQEQLLNRDGSVSPMWSGSVTEIADSNRMLRLSDQWSDAMGLLSITMVGEFDWSSLSSSNVAEPWDVCLQIDDTKMAFWPWEDAWAEMNESHSGRRFYRTDRMATPVRIRWLQTALRELVEFGLELDGVDSPQLRRAIKTFQATSGLPPTGQADTQTRAVLDRVWRERLEIIGRRVLILGEPMRGAFSNSFNSGFDIHLEAAYRECGFEVYTANSFADLVAMLQSNLDFSIVHLNGILSEGRSQGVFFDLQHVESTKQGTLNGRALADVLNHLPDRTRMPLVIVQPTQMATRLESMRQHTLRNAFAAELFRSSQAVSVLATDASDRSLTRIIIELVAGASLIEAAQAGYDASRGSPTRGADDDVRPLRPVLLTADPDQSISGVGAPSTLPVVPPDPRKAAMSRTLYALLVGIDSYQPPVPKLSGCVNDIATIESYLNARVGSSAGVSLQVRKLINAEATRQAVIDGFRQHLSQAKRDDIVLFYFSGHGSQEQAPQEFWAIEPDRLNETLVCYDSRLGQWDLADKELSVLISEVSKSGAHCTVILDCCHSGSGTREIGATVRRAPIDMRQRPLDSYLVKPELLTRSSEKKVPPSSSGWSSLSSGRHVLMAACRDHEEAKEYIGDGKRRGAFSYFLGNSLQHANSTPTYRDLFSRTMALIRSHVPNQAPQLEAMHPEDLDRVFLDGAIQPTPRSFTASHQQGQWQIDGGSANGLPPTSTAEPIRLALFKFNATADEIAKFENVLAKAKVIEVLPASSRIEIDSEFQLGTKDTFKAVPYSLPTPRLPVMLEGDTNVCEAARRMIERSGPDNSPSLYIRAAASGESSDLRLLARDGQFIITRGQSERPLVAEIPGWTDASAATAVQRLEHIARWQQTAALANSNSSIEPNAIKLSILVDGVEATTPAVRLEYKLVDGKLTPPTFSISLTNRSQRPLHCAILNLTQRFAVNAGYLASGSVRLEPGQSANALDGKKLKSKVPEELFNQGITEIVDILKLIVCTQEFNARLMEQDPLEMATSRSTRSIQSPKKSSSLTHLMSRVQTRDISFEEPEEIDDWQAWQYCFTTVRPLDTAPLPPTGQTVELAHGVRIEGHPALKAKARLSDAGNATRGLIDAAIPSAFSDNPELFEPLLFSASRGTSPGLSVLELTDVVSPESVTPEQPLRLSVPVQVAAEEHVVPVAYDGEFFLPIGRIESRDAGSTTIVLERLPDPPAESRSLGSAIRIFFQKTVARLVGLENPYPKLAMVDLSDPAKIQSNMDMIEIRQAIKKSQRVVLFIHGIIGETKYMVPCMGNIKLENGKPLSSLFDVVLSFDYENLGTSVKDNAALLKSRLAEVGLGPDSGKKLDIVAHSMGGLVSRWFIEQLEGNRVASRLILLGTPNAGSPWPRIADWATIGLGLALNHFTVWPVTALASLAGYVENPKTALNDMLANSQLLKELNASPDPKIPYYLIAGNTSLVAPTESSAEPATTRIGRLLAKLASVATLPNIVYPFFMGAPNDLAVSVRSMQTVPFPRETELIVHKVPSDHMHYFTEPTSTRALLEILQKPAS